MNYNNLINIREEIIQRYAMFDFLPPYKMKNLLLDSSIPRLIANNINYIPHRRNTSYVISRWFAKEYNLRPLPLKYMLQILKISDRELRGIVKKVKQKKINLVLVGAGGTGQNFAYWAEEIMKYLDDINLFERIEVFDADEFEFSNLLRIPFEITEAIKAYEIKNRQFISRGKISANQSDILFLKNRKKGNYTFDESKNERCLVNSSFSLWNFRTIHTTDENIYLKPKESKNVVFYGAPDLETRANIIKANKLGANIRFVAGLHGDDDCSLTVEPPADMELQTETYGMIKLTTFFFNQFKMTIEFLRFLADDDESKWNKKGEPFMEFNFREFVENG
jgi:hypothetical protein